MSAKYPHKPQTYAQSRTATSASSALAIPEPAACAPLFDVPPEIIEAEIVAIGGVAVTPAAPLLDDLDVLAMWLRVKRNADTRRAYLGAITAFFEVTFQLQPTPENVLKFLALRLGPMNSALGEFQTALLDAKKSPATVKQRVAAVKSLVAFAQMLELTTVDARLLQDTTKTVALRDTRGIEPAAIKKLFKQPAKKHGKASIETLRDTALLTLLYDNALRRAEICNLNVGDFDAQSGALWILGKGRQERERISLDTDAVGAISAYLLSGGHGLDKGPLFRNFDHRPGVAGERLSANGLYKVVKRYGEMIGVAGFRPHRMRHAAITHFLEASDGNIYEAQKLSRHRSLDMVKRYDDNRMDNARASKTLSGLRR